EHAVKDWEYIEAGLSVARTKSTDFLPSPGKFLEWCLEGFANRHGMPTFEEAYNEAVRWIGEPHKWSHKVVFHAAKECGKTELRSQQPDKIKPRFAYCYRKYIEWVVNGAHLDEPPDPNQKRITHRKFLEGDDRAEAIKKLRAETGL
ncbi:MAG: replication protein P, partial [Aequorivita vladivostokensis]|nr:replication protein P [Aequorivita vladivostokensis]